MGCSLLIPPRVRRINYFLTTTESLPVVSVGSGPITQIIFILSAMDSIPSEFLALCPDAHLAWGVVLCFSVSVGCCKDGIFTKQKFKIFT
jgi:hypothetical protein